METHEKKKVGYLYSLDSLRGVAALLIFLHHIPPWYKPFADIPIIANSNLMVELFFVLSGFVIFINYGLRLTAGKNVLAFLFLRLGRLYPVHFVLLILFAALEILKFIFISDSLIPPFSKNGIREFIENITLTQALGFSNNAASFNSPSWSVSVELYTYVVFSLTIFIIGNRYAPVVFFIITVLATFLLASHSSDIYGFRLILRCLSGFFLGCLTALLYQHVKKRKYQRASIYIAPSIVAVMALFLHVKSADIMQYDYIFSLLTSILILVIALSENNERTNLISPFFLLLGKLSYSLYMVHYLVIHIFGIWLYRYSAYSYPASDPTRFSNGKNVVSLNFLQAISVYSALIAVTFALSYAIHLWIERPFRIRSREFVSRLSGADNLKPIVGKL